MPFDHQTSNPPAKFFKYRSMAPDAVKWVERIVCHDEIYFAAAKSFNDPFDLCPAFSLAASKTTQVKDYERLSRKFQPGLNRKSRREGARQVVRGSLNSANIKNTENIIQTQHAEYITERIGVLCVSTKSDDILMWSHYADCHRGVCLEFDGNLSLMAHAHQVEYSRKRNPINAYTDSKEEAMTKALLTKSEQWSYEDEWRLIRYEK